MKRYFQIPTTVLVNCRNCQKMVCCGHFHAFKTVFVNYDQITVAIIYSKWTFVKILPLRTGPLAGLQKLVYVVYFRAPGGILPEITFYQNSTRISTRNQKGPRWHQKWISSAQGGGPGRPPGGPSRPPPVGSRAA